MVGLNITKHAIVRYFNRIEKTYAVTDNNYENFRKEHEIEVKDAEKKIKELYIHKDTIYITKGSYNSHKKAIYYLNKQERIIFVITDNTVITIYKVDFGLDEIGNTQILDVLLENLNRAYSEEEKFVLKQEEELKKLRFDEELINRELEEARSFEKKILAMKQEVEAKRKVIQNVQEELKNKIEKIKTRIIKSSGRIIDV